MSGDSIFNSTTFNTLDASGQQAVRHLFDEHYLSGSMPDWDTTEIFRQRTSLAVSVGISGQRLEKINPASFQFMSVSQKKALENELLFMFYTFSAQFQLDEAEHRRQNFAAQSDQIKLCARLLKRLRDPKLTPELIHAQHQDESEKHLKYLGLTIVARFITARMLELTSAQLMTEQMQEISSAQTNVIKNWMGEVNGRRLYWVWGGGLLASVIEMLPDDFAHKQQGQDAVAAPSPYTGYMSWILYYTRFGINLSLLLKHTIAGPWMSVAESNIPAWERFKTQWNQRKFSLLNDAVWATANMVCFFWLNGAGRLGYLGNVATALLLLMDVSLTIWKFYEESTQHNVDILRYEHDIAALSVRISGATGTDKKVLEHELVALKKAKKQCEFDWQYKKYGLVNDLTYAVGLLAAFCVVCCFFFPPAALAPATVMILGVVGAALCFSLTVGYAAVSGAIDIAKSKATGHMANEELKDLLQQFKECLDEPIKKQLFLDIKQMLAKSEFQERIVEFQKMELVRAVLVNVLIPPLIFVSFIFMPFGIGLAVLAAGFALAVISNMILNSYKPGEGALPEFNQQEYEEFLTNPPPIRLAVDTVTDPLAPAFFANHGSSNGYQKLDGDEGAESLEMAAPNK